MTDLKAIAFLLNGSVADGTDCHSAAVDFGNGSAVEVETGLFLYGMARRLDPKRIVETGTHRGWSSAWLALALKDNWIDYRHKRPPRLFTVDSGDYMEYQERIWNGAGVREFIEFVQISSPLYEPPNNIDMLFLDADHEAVFIYAEFNRFFPFLNRSRAMLLCHDTRLDERAAQGINLIWGALVAQQQDEERRKYSAISHVPMRNMRGLDMIYMWNP